MNLHAHQSLLNIAIIYVLIIPLTIVGQERKTISGALDTLGGPLPKILKAQAKPYYVIADIEVPANRVVTIEPGVVILFKNFTGLHVSGRLMAQGTKTNPIIFTSENDKIYNPGGALMANPYDWNGIYIHDDAFGTMLSHCTVAYSVYGIISDTKYIKLDPVTFKENGKSNLTIEGTKHTVTSAPYKYILTTKDATKDGIPYEILKDPLTPRRNILRYTGIAAAISGLGVGIYYATKFSDSWQKWKDVNDPNQSEKILQEHKDPSYYDTTRDRKSKDLLYMCLGMGAGIIGAAGFTISFTF